MSHHDPTIDRSPDALDHAAPPRDELDGLLRQWHERNRERADAGRAQLVSALAIVDEQRELEREPRTPARRSVIATFRGVLMHRYTRAAACLALLAGLFALVMPFVDRPASADGGMAMVPDGGRLDALDAQGQLVGPCPLKHTDVKVSIGAHFSRVNVTQTYTNPYPFKIEAVYTFPLSHRAAVDRMTMTVGDRVIVGEVKERQKARQIYESAKESGYVASLLEQERPNIFTQSVANIEPGATIEVSIGYVETLQSRDGEYRFDFPMVVGPRYIPGYPGGAPQPRPGMPVLPAQFRLRHGLTLLGPAAIELADDAPATGGTGAPVVTAAELDRRLRSAAPIAPPGEAWWKDAQSGTVTRTSVFRIVYADGAKEAGELYSDGSAVINGRWAWCPPRPVLDELPVGPRPASPDGAGFSPDTDQVPDASRITPMPVRPPARAGHDVSLSVTIDSGGPRILDVKSLLHEVAEVEEGPSRRTLALKRRDEIPNRDFILSWRTDATEVAEAVLTDVDERNGGFVTVVLNPPARVADAQVRPRELVFVLDTSGSMSGFPIEKAKAVMAKAIDAMRPGDTFNLITFAGDTKILWPEPRPATAENQREAQAFLGGRSGGGGTEMMTAINAALSPTGGAAAGLDPMALANLPADGRSVTVIAPYATIERQGGRHGLRVSEGIVLPMIMGIDLPTVLEPAGVKVRLTGSWKTVGGERVFEVREAGFAERAVGPMRICMFLTDGFVGNDQAIVAAVRENAGRTRVFSFGIGNSVNRWLIDELAAAGRGESEVVTLAEESDKAVERFVTRIRNPVLTDIAVRVEGAELTDVVPGTPTSTPGLLPDLYDAKPLVLHARYRPQASSEAPRNATLVISGNAGGGPWERRVPLVLRNAPATFTVKLDGRDLVVRAGNDALPALWARSKVDQVLAPHLAAVQEERLDPAVRQQVVALGESFSIMTPFTSFVAVEKARVTLGGRATLVPVPIELPEGLRWEGFFADRPRTPWREVLTQRLAGGGESVVLHYFGLSADFADRQWTGASDDAGLYQLEEAVADRRFLQMAGAVALNTRDELFAFSADLPLASNAPSPPAEARPPADPKAGDATDGSGEGAKTEFMPSKHLRRGTGHELAVKPSGAASAAPVAPPTGSPATATAAPAPRASPPPPPPPPPPPSASPVGGGMPGSPGGVAPQPRVREARASGRPGGALGLGGGGGGAAAQPAAPAPNAAPPPIDIGGGSLTVHGRVGGRGTGLDPKAAGSGGAPGAPTVLHIQPTESGASGEVGGGMFPSQLRSNQLSATGASPVDPTEVPAHQRDLQSEYFNRVMERLIVESWSRDLRAGSGDEAARGERAGEVKAPTAAIDGDAEGAAGDAGALKQILADDGVASGDAGDARATAVARAVSRLVAPGRWAPADAALLQGRVVQGTMIIEPAKGAVADQALRSVLEQAEQLRDAFMAALASRANQDSARAPQPAAASPDTTAAAPGASLVLASVPADSFGATIVLHDVRDLLGGEAPGGFAARLASFVEPTRWTHMGGLDAAIHVVDGVLGVRAPEAMQAQVKQILDLLRGARILAATAAAAAVPVRVRSDGRLVYDVAALVPRTGPLVAEAAWLVEPRSWRILGGTEGVAWPFGGLLVVQHRPEVLDRVERTLDQMHLALGLPVPPARRAAVEAAQTLPVDDGRTRILVHAVADLVGAVEAAQGLAAGSAGVPIEMEAVARVSGQGGAAEAAAPRSDLRERVALFDGVLVADATPAEHARLDAIFQEMRSEFGLPAKPLARTAEAQEALEREAAAIAARRERLETLHRRLDAPLFARVVEVEDPAATLVDRAALTAELAGSSPVPIDAAVAVSVLLDDVRASRLAGLRTAGLSIDGSNERLKVVAGWIQPQRLAELAMAEGVRRVEIASP